MIAEKSRQLPSCDYGGVLRRSLRRQGLIVLKETLNNSVERDTEDSAETAGIAVPSSEDTVGIAVLSISSSQIH